MATDNNLACPLKTTHFAPGDAKCRCQNHLGRFRQLALEFQSMKNLTLGYPKLRWPTARDKLFKCDCDWWHNAHLDLGGKSWLAYSAGYKKAADALAKQYLRSWQGNDVLVYPMIFLYRQSLELQLKLAIIIAHTLLGETLPTKDKNPRRKK